MTARDMELARAAVGVAKTFNVAFMGLAGTCHQRAAKDLDVPFIAGESCPPFEGTRVHTMSRTSVQSGSLTWSTVQRESS